MEFKCVCTLLTSVAGCFTNFGTLPFLAIPPKNDLIKRDMIVQQRTGPIILLIRTHTGHTTALTSNKSLTFK